MFSLQGKRAAVIGGTTGIGLAVARHYAEAGATVAIAGRRDATREARSFDGVYVPMDVTDAQSVDAGFSDVAQLGLLDVVVVNAGSYNDAPALVDEPAEQVAAVVAVNLLGAIWCLKHAPLRMHDGGSIICTGSAAGHGMTASGYTAYAAAKSGLTYAVRTAAVELGPRQIRVNAISPGGVMGTPMSPPAALIARLSVLERPGEINDLLGLFNLLAADASAYITGENIRVDGGVTVGLSASLLSLVNDAEPE